MMSFPVLHRGQLTLGAAFPELDERMKVVSDAGNSLKNSEALVSSTRMNVRFFVLVSAT